jgi:hypothetical protein
VTACSNGVPSGDFGSFIDPEASRTATTAVLGSAAGARDCDPEQQSADSQPDSDKKEAFHCRNPPNWERPNRSICRTLQYTTRQILFRRDLEKEEDRLRNADSPTQLRRGCYSVVLPLMRLRALGILSMVASWL